MPMPAAIAVPSSALRAKDVVISWSPLKFFKTRANPVVDGGRLPAALPPQALGRTAGRVLDWQAPVDWGTWTVRRCFLHGCVLLGCLQPAFIRWLQDCLVLPPELPANARPQENAVDRHAAAGPERAAALYVFRRAVRALFQHRRA